jgi:hypothetical protein
MYALVQKARKNNNFFFHKERKKERICIPSFGYICSDNYADKMLDCPATNSLFVYFMLSMLPASVYVAMEEKRQSLSC